MTRQEHLMTIAMEECSEVAQRISKAMRFGMLEVQPGQERNNRQRIEDEYNDLVAILIMLGLHYVDACRVTAKQAKVEQFLAYSSQCGTLVPSQAVDAVDPHATK